MKVIKEGMEHSIQIPLLPQTEKDEIEEERKVDHLVEIKQTNGRGPLGSQPKKSVNQIFDEMFEDLENSSIKSCTIFKVSVGLRESNPDAYTPKMVSIGPYHKKNAQLWPTEKYKLSYLRRFLKRREGLDVESCMKELEKLKEEAIKCCEDDSCSTDQFLQMLLLDGCFVVEFLRELNGMCPNGEDKIIKYVGCIQDHILRDLMLLENQLPFVVLNQLHHMTKQVNELSLAILANSTFPFNLPKYTHEGLVDIVHKANAGNVKHLLHLIHMSWQERTKDKDDKEKTKETPKHKDHKGNPKEAPAKLKKHSLRSVLKEAPPMPPSLLHQINMVLQGKPDTDHRGIPTPLKLNCSKEKPKDKEDKVIPNATELSEAGISFKRVGNIYRSFENEDTEDTSLFDIKFENGLIKIPCLHVFDSTESNLRNLIAFEQHSDVHHRYFSDFALFMDHLIQSDQDVNLLRQKGIIVNRIGEDKEVTRIFNHIGKGVSVSDDFYDREGYTKAIEYCEIPWNRMKANLKHNYFSTPWVGASTVAAIILLILTTIQTVLAFTGSVK